MTEILPTVDIEPFSIFIAVVVLGVARITWRTLANYKGTKFSLVRTITYFGVYITLGVAFSALSFLEGVPYWVAIPAIIIVTASALWCYSYSDRRISFWRTNNGSLYFRGGVLMYVIYLAGFIARLAIDVAFIGPSMFDFTSIIQLSGSALYASIATDLLLTFGLGLLIGRSIRVMKRYYLIQRGIATVPNVPVLQKVPAW